MERRNIWKYLGFLTLSIVMVTSVLPRAEAAKRLKICSFNIRWLGFLQNKRNDDLTALLKKKRCDLVVVQELTAPPLAVKKYPDKTAVKPSSSATDFFLSMKKSGFNGMVISSQDSGTGNINHVNDARTEWFVVFFKKSKVQVASDLFNGYIARDVTNHRVYTRVPHAFSFRTKDGNYDFTLISVHLTQKASNESVRKAELNAINRWITKKEKKSPERDFIILGDMNIEDTEELLSVIPGKFTSLNTDARFITNTSLNDPKPYDHVFVKRDAKENSEIKINKNFKVYDLIGEMEKTWKKSNGKFPGSPYNSVRFSVEYSDHHPIAFFVDIPNKDDD